MKPTFTAGGEARVSASLINSHERGVLPRPATKSQEKRRAVGAASPLAVQRLHKGRHPFPPYPPPRLSPMTPPTKLLRVSTDYFVAGAIWSKIYGVWSCTDAAPILHWMRGLTTAAAKIALLKMGAAFEWIAPSQQATPSPSPMRPVAQPAPDTQGTPPRG